MEGRGRGQIRSGWRRELSRGRFFTTSTPQFARLNSCAAVFEFDVDPQGNTYAKNWEWK